ncbi:HTH-type transcriptional regulator ImmR [Candidatus Izimaplasma bacterium HR1]|jgi:transcriptional regulator with XRE-family HTH domain|uniref:helix-turn-helix domain-containing protein n=1 Tax=Candidatus Izimoplasma sp. HR1 TaxID=1541959 RepID=UPI0004F68745|nr:HTH-type transcriptional regulator ImmR [Candidatus Izimaplasma bacterium HR1]
MKNLKAVRKQKGIKQIEVAKFLNVSEGTYSRYESGKINMTPDQLIKLSDFFNVATDYLLGMIDVALTPEQNFVKNNLDDAEVILKKEFNLKLAGETLTEAEARKMLDFLRILRDE